MTTYSYNPTSSVNGKQWISLATQSVGTGPGGSQTMLARVSLTDFRGAVILDTYVLPTATVVNYWTEYTGIQERNLRGGLPYDQVRQFVADAVRNKIIVGHKLWQDLSVLNLVHPAVSTRDLALYVPFRERLGVSEPPLPRLIIAFMGREIALQNQDSLENARASIDLYRSVPDWEAAVDAEVWPCALPPQDFARFYL